MTIRVFKKDDQTFETTGMPLDVNWSYYVTAYAMRDWTEGVPRSIHWPFLRRNLPKDVETEDDASKVYLPMEYNEGLTVRIAPNNYRLLWERNTTDWWVHQERARARGLKGAEALGQERKAKFEQRFVENPKWVEALGPEEVEKVKRDFQESVGASESA